MTFLGVRVVFYRLVAPRLLATTSIIQMTAEVFLRASSIGSTLISKLTQSLSPLLPHEERVAGMKKQRRKVSSAASLVILWRVLWERSREISA